MTGKTISIICVTRNAAEYIEQCLQSIAEQTYPHIEVVIMDGASTDGTQEILEKWNDKIAYWKSEPDKGIYDAMNKALDHISGDWVYFIGADDVLLSDFSNFVKNELIDPNVIYYSNVLFGNKKTGGQYSTYQYLKHCLFHQSILYPVSALKKYKYNTKYKVSADHALNIRLYGDKQYAFKYFDYTIAKYGVTGFSSKYRDGNFFNDLPSFALKYFGLTYYIRLKFRQFKQLFEKKDDKQVIY